MTLNDDNSKDGNSFHLFTENGSACTVRVGSRSLPLYPLLFGCLGVLNIILILIAAVIGIYCGNVSEVPDSHKITAEAVITELQQLQKMQTEAIKDQEETQQELKSAHRTYQQLKLLLEQNMTIHDVLQRQLERLQLERTALMSEASHIRDSCRQCLPGWFLFNTSCYFYSKSDSTPKKNWEDSRSDCLSRGANLVVIDNLEEQLMLSDYLPKMSPSVRSWMIFREGYWIGLTDAQSEGNWVWINNVTQTGGYWIFGEPNNQGSQGEDCGAILNMRNPHQTWFDADCRDTKEWLCEMKVN